MTRIDMLQPVLWAVSLGIAELWRAAGVTPDVVIGHSQGEVTASTFAGHLSYRDGALVMARRSAIARRTSGKGRMLAVDLDLAGAQAALAGFEEQVSIAVNNGPRSCVLSGDTDAVLVLKELLDAEGTFCRLVNVDYASHSPQMEELGPDLMTALAEVTPRAGDVPIFSTVLVEALDGSQLDAAYWTANLRRPVLFADTLAKAFEAGVTHVVEISPHAILGPAIEQLAALQADPPATLTSLRRDQGAPADLARSFAKAYAAGLEPFAGQAGSPVALPEFPWQRQSYWVPAARRRSDASGSGFEVTLTPSPTEADAWTGALALGVDAAPWLRDHQVHDATVLPGTGQLALLLAAARARSGALPAAVTGVRFLSDLTLPDDAPVAASVTWRDDVAQGGSFVLQSLPEGSTSWTTHATARVRTSGAAPSAPAFPAALLDADGPSPADFYAGWAARGLGYGPAFQGITQLHAGDAGVLARVVLPQACRASARAGALHPALWDAALQACLALVAGADADSGAVVPVAVDRIDLHEAFTGLDTAVTDVWSTARIVGDHVVDLDVFDADRHPLLSMRGLRLQPLDLGGDAGAEQDPRVFRLAFEATGEVVTQEATAGADAADGPTPSRWVVVGAGVDGAGDVAAALSARGASTAVLALAAGLREQLAAALASPVAAGVAFLVPGTANDAARRSAILTDLADVVRAASGQPTPPQLAIVTARAQVVDGDGVVPDPAAALAWGFGRVARREHPELRTRLLDVDPAAAGWAPALAAELLGTEPGAADLADDQVVLRGPRRWAGRLVEGSAPEEGSEVAPWATPAQPFRLVPATPGVWEGLEFRPLARRAPAAGQVEIEVSGAALNFIDVMKAMGTYPDTSAGADLLGGEAVGRVVAVGSGVTGFSVGDRVVACAFGSIATHVTVDVEHVVPVPAHLSDADAVGLPLVLLTAWYGLHDLARLSAGETVLIHSATGGLGLAAVAVARHLGATVIATAGSESKRAWLREQGIEHVFDSRDLSWADGVAAVTGGAGVDVVLNSLTGANIPLGLDALAEDGRFVEVGKKNIYAGTPVSLSAFRKGISFAAVDLAGLMSRRPARFAALFAQAWQHVASGAIAPLPVAEYPFADAAEAFREMAQGRHIGKFVLTDPSSVTSVVPAAFSGGRLRADGTYLITGGLGALGVSLASFLASRGAGALALVGRSAPSAAASDALEALRASGTAVEVFSADVASAESVTELLDKVRATMPPLRGVVHAAGLLDDATILNVQASQVDRVLAPKISGALTLDAATASDPLDLFVAFSSAASLIGNAGQAAYAAANAAMDALMAARRRRGLPGLAVQWGPFAEIGLAAAGDHRGARLSDRGMGSFTASEGWAALESFLAAPASEVSPAVGYVPMNLRQWFDAYPDTAAQPTWAVLRAASMSGAPASSGGSEFLASLAAAADGERVELVEGKVRQLVGRVLRLDPASVDRETPFKALGLDSLMGLELRNRLESAFGLKLSPTLLWTYGSSKALAGELCTRLAAAAE
ncbi:MAG: SDR family NAD(P)-dependent oxidoreductase [Kineosporiaceae bacterium]